MRATGEQRNGHSSAIVGFGGQYGAGAPVHSLSLLTSLGIQTGSLLLVGTDMADLAAAAQRRGFLVDHYTVDELWDMPNRTTRYMSAIIAAPSDLADNPRGLLACLQDLVAVDGTILLAVPTQDDCMFPGYQFDFQAIQGLLLQHGFANVRRWPAQPEPDGRSRLWPPFGTLRGSRRPYHGHEWRYVALVSARRIELRARPLVSIIMPVYNERRSFEQTLRRVHEKVLPGVDKEIIVVESNSTDGTREIALDAACWPDVRLVLQERPLGKGYAVREGFMKANGDIILIQDADDEYDVNDYDALLAPLLRYERAFVLGSRHTGSWKLREFADMPLMAHMLNLGHMLFVGLLNGMYGQRLADPFTMYKVFWRDCLHGLTFECNRFDFDFELVIKLLRKGYTPLEVPVAYRSRSFTDGKKVSAFRDPVTWLRALVKYRLEPSG